MKKLYFLDEEEKNRILNLHEGENKRQYLKEQEQVLSPAQVAQKKAREKSGGELDKAIADPAKKAEKIKNIARIVCSLKGDTINTKGSAFDGTSWISYVSQFNIPSTDIAQAKKLCATGGDERLYNIAKIACSVDDATGKIVLPNSQFNGKMFTDYARTYKLTGEVVTKAKTLCGKLGNKPSTSTDVVNKVNNKSDSNVSAIAPRVQQVQKQLGIQNGTGTLDVATLQAMLSKLNNGVTSPAAAGGGLTPEQLQAAQQLTQNTNKPK